MIKRRTCSSWCARAAESLNIIGGRAFKLSSTPQENGPRQIDVRMGKGLHTNSFSSFEPSLTPWDVDVVQKGSGDELSEPFGI
jgi:hypothetical protein